MNLVISQAETPVHTWQCPSLQRSYSSKVLLNVRNTVFVPHCLSVASIHGTTHQVIQQELLQDGSGPKARSQRKSGCLGRGHPYLPS